jgi:hypothetical protein
MTSISHELILVVINRIPSLYKSEGTNLLRTITINIYWHLLKAFMRNYV